MREAAGDHRADEDERFRAHIGERGECGPGAIAADAPADAEQRGADHEWRVDPFFQGDDKISGVEGSAPLENRAECAQGHADGASHDQRQARVPRAGDIEEVEHFARRRHSRDPQPDAEQQPGAERGSVADHDGSPST